MSQQTSTRQVSVHTYTETEIGRSGARYLLAVSQLSEKDDRRITTGELQNHLEVTPASITEMISKLADRGLVDYEKYQGITLTAQGEAIATDIAWRFCVVSTFFDSVLDLDLDSETAVNIAFTLPKEGIFSLHDQVNSPCLAFCPESDSNAPLGARSNG